MTARKIQVGRCGEITLPTEMLSRYNIKNGDVLTLTDLGDGSFLIVRQTSELRQGRTVKDSIIVEKISFEELVYALEGECV